MWILAGTGMVQSSMLFCLDCLRDWADTTDCIVQCKLTLVVGSCDELDCQKGSVVGPLLVRRAVSANSDCRQDYVG